MIRMSTNREGETAVTIPLQYNESVSDIFRVYLLLLICIGDVEALNTLELVCRRKECVYLLKKYKIVCILQVNLFHQKISIASRVFYLFRATIYSVALFFFLVHMYVCACVYK